MKVTKPVQKIALVLLCGQFMHCGAPNLDQGAVNDMKSLLGKTQPATVFYLDNGMEVILVENHANPMITAFTVVKTGSRNEDAATNGAAHFLEHLLFNGTTTRNQQQLYDEMDFFGGYNNAHTGPDFTNYMILMPKDYIAQGMDIQADMLFNSTLPPDKFTKEKGIVIEEIGKDADRPDYQVHNQFLRVFFSGTSYERPVLGTVSTISHLDRERVQQYYHNWYVPNNMTLMVIGDFSTPEMIKLVREKYGNAAPGPLPASKALTITPPTQLKIISANAVGNFPPTSKYLNVGYVLPPPSSPDFHALELLAEHLGGKDNAVLPALFKMPANQKLVNKIDATLDFNRDFSTLLISAVMPTSVDEKDVLRLILKTVLEISEKPFLASDLQAAQLTHVTNEIYTLEKLHYYGIMKAGYLAAGGYEFLRDYTSGLLQVTPSTIQKAAMRYLHNQTPVVTLMAPPSAAHIDTVQSPNHYHLEKLQNGLTLVIQENRDSPVTGIHLLARQKALSEGKNQLGIDEILQRMLIDGGSEKYPGNKLAEVFESIGAELKLFDDPQIPYDDYYTSPRFAFIRLKLIDGFFDRGLALLAELVQHPQLDEASFTDSKKQVMALAASALASTPKVAARLFYDQLLQANPGYGRALGDTANLAMLQLDDVKTFYRRFYNPANLILTISGNQPVDSVRSAVQRLFGGVWGDAGWQPTGQATAVASLGRTVVEKIGKPQSYIYVANKFTVTERDQAALQVLMSLFSDRLAFDLREKQGLAYVIGASAEHDGAARWYTIRMGTRPINIERAINGIKNEIRQIRQASFSQNDVDKTINAMLGRNGMRRLDRVGVAYFLSMAVLDGEQPQADEEFATKLKAVKAQDVERLARQVFRGEDHLIVVVE